MNEPLVYIVILNWNNAADTIECLESMQSLSYKRHVITLIDNSSADDSIQQIREWAQGNKRPVQLTELSSADALIAQSPDKRSSSDDIHFRVVLIKAGENLGFAKGSNLGIRYSLNQKADYVMLLNNDTTSDHESLKILVSFLESNKKYSAATPQIHRYYNRDKTDNCGGKLLWYGARKYFYYNADVSIVPSTGFKEISFISGCVVLFRSELFERLGLLTEKFFHGEEDFEFSWRLKKNGVYAACCFQSVIYHKIGRSVNKAFEKSNLGKIFNYYLVRYIDMRNYFPKLFWYLWRVAYLFYIVPLLMVRHSYSLKTMLMFSRQLLKFSMELDGVDRNLFERFTKNDIS